jgi:hypothetical protein
LNFHLAGINNQNFIMRDEETGTWWQQVSGTAIQGPLKGKQLIPVYNDEVSYAIWRAENPATRVLKPDAKVESEYESADWETSILKMRTVTKQDPNDTLKPRSLILGVTLNGSSRAYPTETLQKERMVVDSLGGIPLFIVAAADGKSIRGFKNSVDGKRLEFFVEPSQDPPVLVDSETGSKWNFSGTAISGPLAGKRLERVTLLKDFWFDWKNYHPHTSVFNPGLERSP